jgi:hypothetical protein
MVSEPLTCIEFFFALEQADIASVNASKIQSVLLGMIVSLFSRRVASKTLRALSADRAHG